MRFFQQDEREQRARLQLILSTTILTELPWVGVGVPCRFGSIIEACRAWSKELYATTTAATIVLIIKFLIV